MAYCVIAHIYRVYARVYMCVCMYVYMYVCSYGCALTRETYED